MLGSRLVVRPGREEPRQVLSADRRSDGHHSEHTERPANAGEQEIRVEARGITSVGLTAASRLMHVVPLVQDHVEANAVLTLSAGEFVPREVLEDLALHVEEVLQEHVNDVAPGASATANFASNSIEIDLVLEGDTAAAVHARLADVIGRLQEHGGLTIRTGQRSSSLHLTSTASQVAAPPVTTLA